MTADIMPFTSVFLYDDGDIAPTALISAAVKPNGALAGTQLVHRGMSTDDSDTCAEIHMSARGAMTYLSQDIHTADEVRDWMRHVVLADETVWG